MIHTILYRLKYGDGGGDIIGRYIGTSEKRKYVGIETARVIFYTSPNNIIEIVYAGNLIIIPLHKTDKTASR